MRLLIQILPWLVMILPSALMVAGAYQKPFKKRRIATFGTIGIFASFAIAFIIGPQSSSWYCGHGYGDCTGQDLIGYAFYCAYAVIGSIATAALIALIMRLRRTKP